MFCHIIGYDFPTIGKILHISRKFQAECGVFTFRLQCDFHYIETFLQLERGGFFAVDFQTPCGIAVLNLNRQSDFFCLFHGGGTSLIFCRIISETHIIDHRPAAGADSDTRKNAVDFVMDDFDLVFIKCPVILQR